MSDDRRKKLLIKFISMVISDPELSRQIDAQFRDFIVHGIPMDASKLRFPKGVQ